jgi:hypothetical protein
MYLRDWTNRKHGFPYSCVHALTCQIFCKATELVVAGNKVKVIAFCDRTTYILKELYLVTIYLPDYTTLSPRKQ